MKKAKKKKTRLLINSISSVGLVDKGANTAADVLFTKRVSDEATHGSRASTPKVATKKSSVTSKGTPMKQKAKNKKPIQKDDEVANAADTEAENVESQTDTEEEGTEEEADAATPATTPDVDDTDLSDRDIEDPADEAAEESTDESTDDESEETEDADVETAKAADLEKADLLKRVADSEARAAKAESIAKVERNKRLEGVAIEKAGRIAGNISDADEFGPVLRRMHQKMEKADVTYIESIITKANSIVGQSDLLKSVGSDDGEDVDFDDASEAEVKLNKMATARAVKDEVSFEVAYLKVAEENPDLYDEL